MITRSFKKRIFISLLCLSFVFNMSAGPIYNAFGSSVQTVSTKMSDACSNIAQMNKWYLGASIVGTIAFTYCIFQLLEYLKGDDDITGTSLEDLEEFETDITECVICMEEFNTGERIATLSCNHVFHRHCIMGWFNQRNNCPCCRRVHYANNLVDKKFKKKEDDSDDSDDDSNDSDSDSDSDTDSDDDDSDSDDSDSDDDEKRKKETEQDWANIPLRERGNELAKACREGNIEKVRYLVGRRNTSIEISQRRNHIEIARLNEKHDIAEYLRRMFRRNNRDALLQACREGNDDIIRYLVSNGVPVRLNHFQIAVSRYNLTNDIKDYLYRVFRQRNGDVLLQACREGNADLIRYLVNNGAQLRSNHLQIALRRNNLNNDIKNYLRRIFRQRNRNALSQAYQAGDLNNVRFLMEQVNYHPNNRGQLLSRVIAGGQQNIVEYLLDSGVAPTLQHLEEAVDRNHIGIRLLIYRGLLRNSNYGNRDLLNKSLEEGSRAFKYLFERGNEDKNLILREACRKGNLDVAKILVEEKNADIDERSGLDSPLDIACSRGCLDIAKYFIEHRDDNPAKRNRYGLTPLHYAARGGRLDVVKYLVEEKNMDISLETYNKKKMPFHYAFEKKHSELIEYLVEKGGSAEVVQQPNPDSTEVIEEEEDEGEICSICYEAFEENAELGELPCGHIYCFGCINRWLNSEQYADRCPYCRASASTNQVKKQVFKKNT